MVSVWVLTISTSPELVELLEEELLEPPRLPALVVPVPALEEPVELEDPDEPDDEEVPVPELEPETLSPGEMLATETTVPPAGA
jgi:hypothetical protein